MNNMEEKDPIKIIENAEEINQSIEQSIVEEKEKQEKKEKKKTARKYILVILLLLLLMFITSPASYPLLREMLPEGVLPETTPIVELAEKMYEKIGLTWDKPDIPNNSDLQINDNSQSRLDVHFSNLRVGEGSIPNSSVSMDLGKTVVSFNAGFTSLNQYYMFYVDVVNNDFSDARIDEIIKTELTEEQSRYLVYEVTYEDDSEIKENDLLKAGEKETLKFVVKTKDVSDPNDLPTSNQTIELTGKIIYVENDGKGVERIK